MLNIAEVCVIIRASTVVRVYDTLPRAIEYLLKLHPDVEISGQTERGCIMVNKESRRQAFALEVHEIIIPLNVPINTVN